MRFLLKIGIRCIEAEESVRKEWMKVLDKELRAIQKNHPTTHLRHGCHLDVIDFKSEFVLGAFNEEMVRRNIITALAFCHSVSQAAVELDRYSITIQEGERVKDVPDSYGISRSELPQGEYPEQHVGVFAEKGLSFALCLANGEGSGLVS